MNTTGNVILQTLATGAVADGLIQVKTNLLLGVILVVIGVVLYTAYEFFPSKP